MALKFMTASRPAKSTAWPNRSKKANSRPLSKPSWHDPAYIALLERADREFDSIAKLIHDDPPGWLGTYMRAVAFWVWRQQYYYDGQPKRRAAISSLRAIEKATNTIITEFADPAIVEFIYSERGPGSFLPPPPVYFADLLPLRNAASKAAKHSKLTAGDGKALPGRVRAAVTPTLSARTYCAMAVAEIWRHLKGSYPLPRNRKAAEAAQTLWSLSTNARPGAASDPQSLWRGHFEIARSISAQRERDGFLDSLRDRDSIVRIFATTSSGVE